MKIPRLCTKGKRAIAATTAFIYVVAAMIMVARGDYAWAEVQAALSTMSVITAVTL